MIGWIVPLQRGLDVVAGGQRDLGGRRDDARGADGARDGHEGGQDVVEVGAGTLGGADGGLVGGLGRVERHQRADLEEGLRAIVEAATARDTVIGARKRGHRARLTDGQPTENLLCVLHGVPQELG